MTEIDKKNLKNYLCFTFGITYISWGLLAIFTQSYILGLETFIGRILHIVGALGPAIASGFYLKSNNIKFKHFLFNYLMPLFFIQLIFFGGGHEELGWRGILQPLLDKKYTYWQSNLIVGSIWGIWHLPLWFIVGESHQGFPFILFFIYTLFLSFVLGLLYRQTKSVGYCVLFHAFANLLNLYFVLKINLIFIIIFIGYLIYTILASNRIGKEK
ncbi:CPBP family intramembrane metalloprotease [Streptococcus oralis subsp. oralis]|uniref:CPBP family intramembrane metalloprotease n=1 Tax=Streptococcus oralis subsp. oralis TaxID=1891914 RepID=A0A1X1HCU0_STROR|nr:CPBP family intramembrane glutamic endopeptidase [Streptococcus oralis]ORO58641.1 CPBP family intramembrane metalloprotease [Streptococcus oralis subsp. oralis]